MPGAFFEWNGERIRIHAATVEAGESTPGTVIDDKLLIACGDGAIRPIRVQRAGKGIMSTAELLRGFTIPIGTALA